MKTNKGDGMTAFPEFLHVRLCVCMYKFYICCHAVTYYVKWFCENDLAIGAIKMRAVICRHVLSRPAGGRS
jgi:hypothetical protein